MTASSVTENKILSALPAKVYSETIGKFEPFELELGHKLYEEGDIFSHVYFIESGLISILAADDEHTKMEIAMVGNEGMIASPVFLCARKSTCCATVLGEGYALRMRADKFLAECRSNEDLSREMNVFIYSIIVQLTRSTICNRFHSTESRLARWLLMTQDRMGSEMFRITQNSLSYMVAVRREAINKAAVTFQRTGYIKYTRGQMTILDRKALEASACVCYGILLNG